MKLLKKFTLLCIMTTFVACSDERTSLGVVEYYPSFLWVDEMTTPSRMSFDFNFSEDAQKDNTCYAEFQFVDKDGKPIPSSKMQVFADGKQLPANKLLIYSKDLTKELLISFSPIVDGGNHQGSLKLVRHNLDRIESQSLPSKDCVYVLPWSIQYEKRMNPLAKALMWIGIILSMSLIVWFLLLKPFYYPRIRVLRLEMSSKNGYYVNKRINGFRKVIITNRGGNQNIMNKLFTGKILYIVNEIWTEPWELTPKGRKKIAKINLHGKYMISPVTSEIANYGTYQLDNLETKESITIKIL